MFGNNSGSPSFVRTLIVGAALGAYGYHYVSNNGMPTNLF
jgi:hypothetical protein